MNEKEALNKYYLNCKHVLPKHQPLNFSDQLAWIFFSSFCIYWYKVIYKNANYKTSQYSENRRDKVVFYCLFHCLCIFLLWSLRLVSVYNSFYFPFFLGDVIAVTKLDAKLRIPLVDCEI